MARYSRDTSEVSSTIKYLVFGFNVLFWLLGGVMLAVGLWAWTEKDMFQNLGKLSQFPLDPALILILTGMGIFIIGFAGCVGALRENTGLLLIYCISVGVIFFAELSMGVIIFMYKDWVREQMKISLKKTIVRYRDDPDLQNLIDWVQEDWLKCCGMENAKDWDLNVYFNCSSPSREACGVPYSCCKPDENAVMRNWQCGYDTRKEASVNASVIYPFGCIDQGEQWITRNFVPVAGAFIGLAVVQILGVCLAQNLRSDIFAQKSKWERARDAYN